MEMLLLHRNLLSLHLSRGLNLQLILLLILLLEAYLTGHLVSFLLDGLLRMHGAATVHILIQTNIRLR